MLKRNIMAKNYWKHLDKSTGGELSFFLRNAGKTKFMLVMSKKLQILGFEKLYLQNPWDFFYFFFFFLVRDTILYIILPIGIVSLIDL